MDLTQLRIDVAFELHRTDLTDAQLDTFIARGMARIGRQLRSIDAESAALLVETATPGTYTLPADYARMRVVRWSEGGRDFELKPMSALEAFKWSGQGSSRPVGYRVIDGALVLFPGKSGTLSIEYYTAPAALTGGSSTNYVTDNYPELALYSAVVEGGGWERDTETIQLYSGLFDNAMTVANDEADKARYGAGPVAGSHYQAPTGLVRSM